MANKVVLKQNEINQFTEDLFTYHRLLLSGIKKVHRDLSAINNSGAYPQNNSGLYTMNIFQMDQTSRKMQQLLDTVDTNILPLLYNTLGESNECARLLVQIMNGLDS